MQRSFVYWLVLVVNFLMLGTAGCSKSTEPTSEMRDMAGTYTLVGSSGGSTAAAASFVLTADGRAEQHVRYIADLGRGDSVYVSTGTFELRQGGAITFTLGQWVVDGMRSEDQFTLEYPGPVDAPIRETYGRQ